MDFSRLRVLSASLAACAMGLLAGCATSTDGSGAHDAAVKTHLEFARDFENLGNDSMAQYHLDLAAREQEQNEIEACDFACTLIEVLFDEVLFDSEPVTVYGPN